MCFSQFFMVFFKQLNIRIVMSENVLKAVFMTLLIQLAWLISTAIGVNALWERNYILVFAYLLSGMLGAYFNFKIKI